MAQERRKRIIPRALPLFVLCLLLFVSSTASIIPVVDSTKKNPSNSTKTQSLKQRLQQRLEKLLEKQLQRVLILIGKKNSSGSWPSPRVIDEFLSADEAAQLLERYTPLLQQKSGFLNSKGKLNRASKYRSSSTVRVPPLGDPLILQVERRAADAAKTLPHAYCEDFQLACYESGELYGLHRDDDDDEKRNADRIATVLVYLEAPELSQGGGETLFTHRSMEEESLKTEQGALKLFQSYCNRPKRRHKLVEPVVGRAVTWQNWYPNEKNETTFARESTHGACPVREGPGRKCVIQQWIRKSKIDPLREECVAGIFPLGADFSYRELSGGHTAAADGTCFKDVSAQGGVMIPSVCIGSSSSSGERGKLLPLDGTEGPLEGVGAIQISGYSSYVSAPVSWTPVDIGSLTVSFWARKAPEGTVLFSLQSPASVSFIQVRYLGKNEAGKEFYELRVPSTGKIKILEILHWGSMDDWFWYSLAYDAVKGETSFSVYSSKHHMGTERIGMGECGKAETTCKGTKPDVVRLLELPLASRICGANGIDGSEGKAAGAPGEKAAFVAPSVSKADSTPPPPSVDISFLIFHTEARTNESTVLALSKQARRYDVNV
jgi:hypothetical protein